MVLVLLACSLCLVVAGILPAALFIFCLSVGAGLYLYKASSPVAYYSLLRENALLQLSKSDLASGVLLPVYTGVIGALAGAVAGYWLFAHVVGPIGMAQGRDTAGLICFCTLLAFLVGNAGRMLGEAYLRWKS